MINKQHKIRERKKHFIYIYIYIAEAPNGEKINLASIYMVILKQHRISRTLFGAGSKAILALVIIPNCPKPPRTA
jgi:hypothetical protein